MLYDVPNKTLKGSFFVGNESERTVIQTEEKKDYKRRIYYLPSNYKKGISILGQVYPVPNVIQAVLMVGIHSLLFHFFHFGWEWQINAIVYLLILIVFGSLGLYGIDGEDFISFLKRWLRFHRRRRTAYYNPRIKMEAVMPQYDDSVSGALLPKERINRIYEEYRNNMDERQRKKDREREETAIEQGGYIFLDDLKKERDGNDSKR